MKRSKLTMMVVLAGLLVCGVAFAAGTGKKLGPSATAIKRKTGAADANDLMAPSSGVNEMPKATGRPGPRPGGRPAAGSVDRDSLKRKLAFLEDSNGVRDAMQAFDGLDADVGRLTKGSSRAMRGWSRRPGEDNLMLAKVIHEQVMQELALIHKLAKEEGAQKTLAALEGLMLEREGRYSKMFARMERQRKRARRGGRGMRGGRRGGRYDQEQDYNGQRGERGRYDDGYDRRGGRYQDRGGYRDSRRREGYRQDDYSEEERPTNRR